MRSRRVLGVAAALAMAAPAASACPASTEATAAAILAGWRDRVEIDAPAVADGAAAVCVRDVYAAALGAPIGWKVGLTSKAAQEAFGVDRPVAGRLVEGMLLPDGAVVSRGYGARPVVEADLLVVVRDAGVMAARTPLEALAHLESLVPFIELADLMIEPGQPLSAVAIVAINVGARLGVAGAPVPLEATEDWVAALGAMTVRLEAPDGAVVAEIPGAAILGHPLNALIWLVEELAASGGTLAPGDVVSLGSFGPPQPPDGLDGLVVRYLGLPGGIEPAVSVSFE